MDASEASVLAALARHRAELREAANELDRAAEECRHAKREALETLAELDAVLSSHGNGGL